MSLHAQQLTAETTELVFSKPVFGCLRIQLVKLVNFSCHCRHDIKLDIYHWHETDEQLETKWRVSGVVQLPWKPLLAAAGGTTHVFSQVRWIQAVANWQYEFLLVPVHMCCLLAKQFAAI